VASYSNGPVTGQLCCMVTMSIMGLMVSPASVTAAPVAVTVTLA
jgi:hypothetical protein